MAKPRPQTEHLARLLAEAYYQHPIDDQAWSNLTRDRWIRVAVVAEKSGTAAVTAHTSADAFANMRREWMIA